MAEQLPTESQKRKRLQPRRIGCLRLLLIPVFLIAACYGGMWVFARYGGEWVMSDQIPIPPESQLIHVDYREGPYKAKTSIYFHTWTPDMLRDWFIQEGISLTPILYIDYDPYSKASSGQEKYFEYDDHYSTMEAGRHYTLRQQLHIIALLTTNWFEEMTYCYCGLSVYKTKEAFLKYYPDLVLPERMSAFSVSFSWPYIK